VLSAAFFVPSNNTTTFDLSYLPAVFFGAWILVSGVKIYRAGKSTKAPSM